MTVTEHSNRYRFFQWEPLDVDNCSKTVATDSISVCPGSVVIATRKERGSKAERVYQLTIPELPPEDFESFCEGEEVVKTGTPWELTRLYVVSVNYALRAVAIRLGLQGGIVVWPLSSIRKMTEDDRRALRGVIRF